MLLKEEREVWGHELQPRTSQSLSLQLWKLQGGLSRAVFQTHLIADPSASLIKEQAL